MISMGLFGKKKKNSDDVRVFSEGDIQKKLYGHLDSENVREVKTRPKIEPPFQNPNRSPNPSMNHSQSIASQDLFDAAATEKNYRENSTDQQSETNGSWSSSQVPSESQAETEHERISNWVDEEQETLSNTVSTTKTPVYSNYTPQKPKVKQPHEIKKKGPGIGSVFSKALKVVVQVLANFAQLFVGGLLGFLFLFDLRKKQVRRVFYFLVVVAAIFSLFFGIHKLNVQREAAMSRNASTENLVGGSSIEKEDSAKARREAAALAEKKEREKREEARKLAEAEKKEATSSNSSASEGALNDLIAQKPYVIQVATYATTEDAERMAKKFREGNITAFVKPLSRPSGKMYYCVFLGRYADYREADGALKDFKQNDLAAPFQDAFVRKLNK